MDIISIKNCEIFTDEGIMYIKKNNSCKPLYKLFRHYIGRWILFSIQESFQNGWDEVNGFERKFKVTSVNCNGEILGKYKWRKRSWHAWKHDSLDISSIIKPYADSEDSPRVHIRVNPNVSEMGGKDLDTIVYRIENSDTQAGMWYNYDGSYNGVIFELTDGKSKNIPMEYDEVYSKDNKNWYSGTRSIDQLLDWFTEQDILELIDKDYNIYKIECTDFIRMENQILFTRESVTRQTLVPLGSIANRRLSKEIEYGG